MKRRIKAFLLILLLFLSGCTASLENDGTTVIADSTRSVDDSGYCTETALDSNPGETDADEPAHTATPDTSASSVDGSKSNSDPTSAEKTSSKTPSSSAPATASPTAAPATSANVGESSFSMEPKAKKLGPGQVSLYINCVNAVKAGIRNDPKYAKIVPANGIILDEAVNLEPGESVLALLRRVAKEKGIAVNVRSGYLAGVGGVNEKQFGGTDGWLYSVNGEFPRKGIRDYILKEGDSVALFYTVKKGDVPGGIVF